MARPIPRRNRLDDLANKEDQSFEADRYAKYASEALKNRFERQEGLFDTTYKWLNHLIPLTFLVGILVVMGILVSFIVHLVGPKSWMWMDQDQYEMVKSLILGSTVIVNFALILQNRTIRQRANGDVRPG